MLEIIDERTTPCVGWSYRHKESGKMIISSSWAALQADVRMFFENNNYPIPADLTDKILLDMNDAIVEKCERMGVLPSPFVRVVGGPTLVDKAKSFATAMKTWVSQGMPVLTHEDYDKRLSICKRCGYWRGETALGFVGCGKCGCTAVKLFLGTTSCPLGRW